MKITSSVLLLFLISLFTACSSDSYNVAKQLDKNEQHAIKMELARYMDKLAPRTEMNDRWNAEALPYYTLKADSMHLLKYYKNEEDGYEYFYITRLVPSIRAGERRASAGRFKRYEAAAFNTVRLIELEEFFLTNVLSEDTLVNASNALFVEAIATKKIADDSPNIGLIEWPNDYFAYNKKDRGWDRIVLMESQSK